MERRLYKYVAFDINDRFYSKEFTDFKKMNDWIKSPENKSKKIEYVSPQEYEWLLKQPKKKS